MFPLARYIALRKNRSTTKTAILPLSRIKKAFVLIDRTEAEYELAEKMAKEFFKGKGIEAIIIAPDKKDLGLLGRIKRKVRGERQEDLFISLYPINRFEAEYEAKCSSALFKVGRYSFKDNIFDLIVRNRENEFSKQWEVFETIKELLEKIK